MTENRKDRDELISDHPIEKDTSRDSRSNFVVENMLPDAVFTPKTSEDLQDFIAQSNQENLSIIPFGGGTRKNFGMPPSRYDIALDMSELNGVINHNPDDLTISVQAATTLDSLQSVLLEHGQFLPISAPLSNLSTIGGILASDTSGPIKWSFKSGNSFRRSGHFPSVSCTRLSPKTLCPTFKAARIATTS